MNITQTKKETEKINTDKDVIMQNNKNKSSEQPVNVNRNESMPIDKFHAETEHLIEEQKDEIKKLI